MICLNLNFMLIMLYDMNFSLQVGCVSGYKHGSMNGQLLLVDLRVM